MALSRTRRYRLADVLPAIAVVLALLGGCGDEAPSSIGEADLSEDAGFWSSLGNDLKRELASICQSEQVKNATVAAEVQVIQDFDTDDYVVKIDDYFSEDGSGDIGAACDAAKKELALETFNELAPHIGPGGVGGGP